MRTSFLKILLGSHLLSVSVQAGGVPATAPGPVLSGGVSFDQITISACFDKPLNPLTATNPANYSLDATNTQILSALLRPDQTSVVLSLSRPLTRELFYLSWTNIQDLTGNFSSGGPVEGFVRCYGSADVGIKNVDPLEKGILALCFYGPEVTVGGSGLEGTQDGFHFLYRLWHGDFFVFSAEIVSLEPANRLSKTGLMVRESLDPGSRFFCVMVTPPDVPARDGSGNGADEYQATFRDVTNGPVAEWPGGGRSSGVPYPNAGIILVRADGFFTAYRYSGLGEAPTIARCKITNFPEKVFIGLATTAANNNRGFTTTARYAEGILLDSTEPVRAWLKITRSGESVAISWPGNGYILQSSPRLGPGAVWSRVTDPVTFSEGLLSVVIPVRAAQTRFFRLKHGLFECLD